MLKVCFQMSDFLKHFVPQSSSSNSMCCLGFTSDINSAVSCSSFNMKCIFQETVCYSWWSKSQFPKSWCYFVRKFCQSYLAMCPQLTRASVRADCSMLMVQHLLQLGLIGYGLVKYIFGDPPNITAKR